MTLTFPVVPVAKPRMTRSDVWRKRPAVLQYRAYCDELRLHAKRHSLMLPPAGLRMVFHLPMPPSWSKAKRARMCDQPHQTKPDLDNLVKAVLDAMLPDDSGVYDFSATKLWAEQGGLTLQV